MKDHWRTKVACSFCILVAGILFLAGAATPPVEPPAVTLDVPPVFRTAMTVEHFHAGDDVLHIDWIKDRAIAPMTAKTGDTADEHPWTIDVYNIASPKVEAAYAHAKDGYEADLDEWKEFLLPPSPRLPGTSSRTARAYLFARYARKHFRWGNAVSFFSQATQDTAIYAPDNGHLTCEVWGVTKDHRHTVVGWFRVSHPKLSDWGEGVRDMRDTHHDLDSEMTDAMNRNDVQLITKLRQMMGDREDAAMRSDPGYKLSQNCSSDEFEPSLSAVDKLVGSLRVK